MAVQFEKIYQDTNELGMEAINEFELEKPQNKPALLSLVDIVITFLVLLFVVAQTPPWIRYTIGFILAIRLFNMLAQVTHGSTHNTMFTSTTWNKRLGFLSSSLLGYKAQDFHLVHNDHHLYLNTPKDGDAMWSPPGYGTSAFLKDILLDLTGFQAFKRLAQYLNVRKTGEGKKSNLLERGINIFVQRGPTCIVQGCLLSIFYIAGAPWAYFLNYLLPLCTLYPAQARMRSLAEHHVSDSESDDKNIWVTRSTLKPFLEKHIIAPLGSNFHLEHHLFPQIPLYNLKKINRYLTENIAVRPPTNEGYFGYTFRFLLQK